MKKKHLKITEDQEKKCHAIIHAASVAAGGVGAAGAQIPVADNAVIVPIQISMIIGLGKVFNLEITKSVASGLIKSAAASFVGRGISQVLFGWVPVAGNAINTATASGITEAIGWMSVKEFSEKAYKYTSGSPMEDTSVESENSQIRSQDWAEQSNEARKDAETASSHPPKSATNSDEEDPMKTIKNRFQQ